ncbi:hypothetical protein RHSIM_Rhsim03G0142800 [Rhododendron simsii]|uniref:Uncharacterized protein n=1 Tax=Rhododendron simsii TaxID=118357 RepID=A0A834LVP4_RHOSS|nr:hypothetical protein RHSIM_Rhsim03G0142800 [Rhododendron simsii]
MTRAPPTTMALVGYSTHESLPILQLLSRGSPRVGPLPCIKSLRPFPHVSPWLANQRSSLSQRSTVTFLPRGSPGHVCSRFLDMWNSNPNTCFTGISSTYFLLFMSSVVLEVVLYWENTDAQPADSKESTIKGPDAEVFGPNENHFVILDEDKTGLDLYVLPGGDLQEVGKKNVLDEQSQATDLNVGAMKGPLQCSFFSKRKINYSVCFSWGPDWPGLKLVHGYRLSNSDGHYISTKDEGRKAIKLKVNEIVLQDLIQHRHPILLL